MTQEHIAVTLMRDYLERAVAAMEKGNVPEAATLVRIAYSFEQDIPDNLRFGN